MKDKMNLTGAYQTGTLTGTVKTLTLTLALIVIL